MTKRTWHGGNGAGWADEREAGEEAGDFRDPAGLAERCVNTPGPKADDRTARLKPRGFAIGRPLLHLSNHPSERMPPGVLIVCKV